MARRFIRTMQQSTVDDRGRPVETVKEREVVRALREPEGVTVYDPGSALPERYRTSQPAVSEPDGLTEIVRRVRAQESWARTQSGVLREIDYRLGRVEEASQAWAATRSIEQTTWWALWGILMMMLGSALTVVLALIFTSAIR
jgi:hypothetical protein